MKNACTIFSLSVSKSWKTGNTGIFTKKPGYMDPPTRLKPAAMESKQK
jgi:hypothetical protein